jgi:hypothetical protein
MIINNHKFINKILLYWFIILSFILYVQPSTLNKYMGTIGLIAAALIYIIFYFGTKINLYNKKHIEEKVITKTRSKLFMFLLSLTNIFSTSYTLKFYTGSSISTIFSNLSSGTSNYALYQLYFAESGLNVFSVSKIFPIILLAVMKMTLIYSIYNLVLNKKLYSTFSKLLFVMNILMYCVFSLGRGTTFEFFEIFLCFAFLKSYDTNFNFNIRIFQFKNLLIFIGILLIINLFNYSINLRGVGGEKILMCYTSEICYNADAQISILFPQFSYFLFISGGYFSFGLNFLGVLFTNIYFQDIDGIFQFLVGGNRNNFTNAQNVCSLIDCGVNWEPDISVWINKFGLFLLITSVASIGVFFRYLINTSNYTKNKFVQIGICYFIFLQLISFPCGQFIVTSSSNILSLFLFVSYFLVRKIA